MRPTSQLSAVVYELRLKTNPYPSAGYHFLEFNTTLPALLQLHVQRMADCCVQYACSVTALCHRFCETHHASLGFAGIWRQAATLSVHLLQQCFATAVTDTPDHACQTALPRACCCGATVSTRAHKQRACHQPLGLRPWSIRTSQSSR